MNGFWHKLCYLLINERFELQSHTGGLRFSNSLRILSRDSVISLNLRVILAEHST